MQCIFLCRKDNFATRAAEMQNNYVTFGVADLAYANDSFLSRPTMLL